MSAKEMQISVPWGIIAGKAFGDEHKKLVVAFHGFQDNANSFDNLIPLLSKSFYYISFDLPSHGKSSHLITKSLPTVFDFVLAIKLILDHLNRQKYILMGHSFGAQCIIIYTHMYPERVEKLISLDSIYYLPIDADRLIETLKNKFQLYSKLHKMDQNTAPTYFLQDSLKKFQETRGKAATVLLQRMLEPLGDDKYKFTLAQHLKYLLWPSLDMSYLVKLMEANPIKCPHLLLKASLSKPYYDMMEELIDTYKSTNKSFKSFTVKGTHDIHIKNPEVVAKYINNFFLSNKL